MRPSICARVCSRAWSEPPFPCVGSALRQRDASVQLNISPLRPPNLTLSALAWWPLRGAPVATSVGRCGNCDLSSIKSARVDSRAPAFVGCVSGLVVGVAQITYYLPGRWWRWRKTGRHPRSNERALPLFTAASVPLVLPLLLAWLGPLSLRLRLPSPAVRYCKDARLGPCLSFVS